MKSIQKLILRSIREGTLQLWRNRFLSFTTILLGSLILLLINFVFAIQFYADTSLKDLESRADFAVPLRADFDSFDLEAMQNELGNFNLLSSVYQEMTVDGIQIPAHLKLKFGDLREVDDVFTVLSKTRYDSVVGVRDIDGEREFVTLINRLIKIRDSVEKASFWLSFLFLAGGILLVINTFRIALFSRKDEIFISRFVGADAKFIVGPYLVEGLLFGIISSFIAIFVFMFLLREINALPGGDIFMYMWDSVFSNEIMLASAVGIAGAWISVKRYLSGRYE